MCNCSATAEWRESKVYPRIYELVLVYYTLYDYVGREHQGTIEIFEIEQHKHRHTYRPSPPLHTPRNKLG